MQAIYDVLDEGKDLENFLWEMIKHSKDVLMCKVNRKLDLYTDDEQKQMRDLAESVSKEELINIIYKLSELEGKMRVSSQKVIIFETEIIKLCMKMDTSGFEERISKLEDVIKNGAVMAKPQASPKVIEPISRPVTVSIPSSSGDSARVQKEIQKPEPKKVASASTQKFEPLAPGTVISGWQNVLTNLKSQGKVMLYANLINTEVVELNDMTVSIRFNNGLTPFRKELLEKSENLGALNKEIAMLCGKTMQIKFEDASGGKQVSNTVSQKQSMPKIEAKSNETYDKKEADNFDDIDFEINFVDEE